MKKTLAMLLVIATLTIMLVSCGGSDSIIGTWKGEEEGVTMTIVFNDDGTGSVTTLGQTVEITYTAEDGKLNATMEVLGTKTPLFKDAEYSVSGSELTITVEGEAAVFEKQ